jgi:L-2,4-diaminobutyrate decarboxylase
VPPTSDELRAAFDPETFRSLGHRTVDQLADHLARATRGAPMPVLPWSDPAALLARWPGAFPDAPSPDLPADFAALLARTLDDSNHLHHPRYVGHQVTSPLPLAALCDLAAALLNNSMAVYEMGPAATVMERRVVAWLAGVLGLGARADGILTSGGSAGNLTALLAARQARAGFDVWGEGNRGGPPLAVLVSEQAHYSVRRALQIMGLGRDAALPVPCDERFRLRPDALDAALGRAVAAGRRAIAVVASAGSTATGAFDPLEPIAELCERHGLWLHVDGAHGAVAALSPRTRGLVRGIGRADSVVLDPHKMMLAPALVSAVLYRDGARAFGAFAQEASYLFHGEDAPAEPNWWDGGLRTLECTKRMLGFKLYAALALLGKRFFGDYVADCFALAGRFADAIAAAPDFELALTPECNIVCFRHRPAGLAGAALDAHQSRLRERVTRSGSFYLVQTGLPKGVFLRTTLVNPLTTDRDLEDLLAALRDAA